jgi:hypothetical protein
VAQEYVQKTGVVEHSSIFFKPLGVWVGTRSFEEPLWHPLMHLKCLDLAMNKELLAMYKIT